MCTLRFLLIAAAVLCVASFGNVHGREMPLIDQALQLVQPAPRQSPCDDSFYHVYLIDNFDQQVELVSELDVSHGDLVRAFLVSGREDIRVTSFNMSLGRGLARAILDAANGECIDGVVSAVPGSNYSYDQVATILGGDVDLDEKNILDHKEHLRNRLLSITHNGFPSLKWLLQLDANPIKLREDARKIALIEILDSMGIGVYLPYGNRDKLHRGKVRSVNLLGIARGVRIYSGLDAKGERILDFPYSPLSSGSAKSRFILKECPDATDGLTAHLDINEDGYYDFTYKRNDMVAYVDDLQQFVYAPPPLGGRLLDKMIEDENTYRGVLERAGGVVLSFKQYRRLTLSDLFDLPTPLVIDKQFVWLNSERYGPIFSFDPECRVRGTVEGSSFIPPLKIKELLVRRGGG